MNDADEFITWHGRAVAGEPPHGASIIVYRKAGQGYEFLILDRGQMARISRAIAPGRRRPGRAIRASQLKTAPSGSCRKKRGYPFP